MSVKSVFVSSTSNDLLEYRKEAVKAIQRLRLHPINMENFGSQPGGAVQTSLREVAKAEFFVGIFAFRYGYVPEGDEKSVTEQEYDEAVRRDIPRFIYFAEPSNWSQELYENDETAQKKLGALKDRINKQEVRSFFETKEQLAGAIATDLAKWLTESEAETLLQGLKNELAKSKALCIHRWITVGLNQEQAQRFADDILSQPIPEQFIPSSQQPIIIVTAAVGAGKTLLAHRIYQSAITRFLNNEAKVFPVFVDKHTAGNFEKRVTDLVDSNISKQVLVIVDSVDEMDRVAAQEILEKARVLSLSLSEIYFVIFGRPLKNFGQKAEFVDMALLSDSEILGIVNSLIESPIRDYDVLSLPATVREAIKYPLFAILFAVYLKQKQGVPESRADLVRNLVDLSLQDTKVDLRPLLEKLAIALTSRSTISIHYSEVITQTELIYLRKTRLIQEDNNRIGFQLQILTEWFAAQAMGNQIIDFSTISYIDIEQWREALGIFVGEFNFDIVSSILKPISSRYPGFASSILYTGLSDPSLGSYVELPSIDECRKQLYEAMTSWAKGIGRLNELIAPIAQNSDQILEPEIGISEDRVYLTTDWQYENARKTVKNAHKWNSGIPYPQPSRAWGITLKELRANLGRVLKQRLLDTSTCDVAEREYTWFSILSLTDRKGGWNDQLIEVKEVLDALNKIDANWFGDTYGLHGHHRNFTVKRPVLDNLLHTFHAMKDQNITFIANPWYISSPNEVLQSTQKIIQGAFDLYTALVEEWFEAFKPHLSKYATFPARLNVHISSDSKIIEYHPRISYYLEPLNYNESNSVLVEYDAPFSFFDMAVYDKLKNMRPYTSKWINSMIGSFELDLFSDRPATELAYEWLWEDLKNTNWLSEDFPRRYRY